MIPTSIDGTDITGATIDGTNVTEITVDGDTVFTAETLPVAYSNLVAWYPFNSSFYGGSDADDATALFNSGQSGDSTAYDGTVSGATFQSTGGVTDINAGANSGAFDFDGSDDKIDLGSGIGPIESGDFTIMAWAKADSFPTDRNYVFGYGTGWLGFGRMTFSDDFSTFIFDGSTVNEVVLAAEFTGSYAHFAMSYNDSANELKGYLDGTLEGTVTSGSPGNPSPQIYIIGGRSNKGFWDGKIDDVRIYDTVLSDSQVQTIYNNTDV